LKGSPKATGGVQDELFSLAGYLKSDVDGFVNIQVQKLPGTSIGLKPNGSYSLFVFGEYFNGNKISF
jgi:hypothetical protein